jgi:hypothetical protein
MPVTVASLVGTPYQVNGAAVTAGTLHRAEHHIYTLAQSRINLNIGVHPLNSSMRQLSGALNAAGDTIYLRFYSDKITSVRLPVPAPPGVNFFMTDNMSGCKFFVDTIGGSNDLIVYHANTTHHGAGLGAAADVQTIGAANQLDNYHNTAQADYAGLVLANVGSLAKPAYFLAAGNEERRKGNQGRQNPGFMGGCTIVGFPAGGSWQFHFQTWGDVGYTRPNMGVGQAIKTFHWNYARKVLTEGLNHAVTFASMRVLGQGRFY